MIKHMLSGKRWEARSGIKSDAGKNAGLLLSERLGVTAATAALLINRGLDNPDKAEEFFRISTDDMHDPFLLNDMNAGVIRTVKAIGNGESIVIYGDYDCDGVTSVSLLYLCLKHLSAKVSYYVPDRVTDGYGMNKDAVDRLANSGASLIITVDNGITANAEVEYASTLGIDTVITDHHECRSAVGEPLPKAAAVINPKRRDSTYPFSGLAGVGVAFKFAVALTAALTGRSILDITGEYIAEYADLVALGTVADVMPLIGENRIFVSLGLKKMNEHLRPCLALLVSDVRSGAGNPVTATTIGYTIAPRINAAGRMERAERAVELFLSEDADKTGELASLLCGANRRRQEEENTIAEAALAAVGTPGENEHILIVAGDNWSCGVVGIVASRLTERFGLPSIVITFECGDAGRGSGRSVEGVSLVKALEECSELLEKYGGHELAAGLTVTRDKLDAFRAKMNTVVARMGNGGDCRQTVYYDAELNINEITVRQIEEEKLLEPFGEENPQPLYLLSSAEVCEVIALSSGKHTKLILKKDGISRVALLFGKPRAALDIVAGDTVDLLFTVSLNSYMGSSSVQLIVKEIRQTLYSVTYDGLIRADRLIEGEEDCPESELCLPGSEDFKTVYLWLKKRASSGNETIFSLREIALRGEEGGDLLYIKLRLIIAIFREAGLITAASADELKCLYTLTLCPFNGKKDLLSTAAYRRARARCTLKSTD